MKKIAQALLFSLVFIVVDRLSYVFPIGQFNITPWNPPAALEVLFIYWAGNFWLAWVYITLCLSDMLVRDTPLLTPAVVLGNAVLVSCYASIAFSFKYFLQRRQIVKQRNEYIKLGLVMVIGAAFTAIAYVTTLTLIGSITIDGMWNAIHQFFIGDLLGFFVVLPLAFVATDMRRRQLYRAMFISPVFWCLLVLLTIVLWIIFSLPIELQMKYFFSLFFILALLAATYSLPGATLAAAMIQLPLVFSISQSGFDSTVLIDMQIVMLTLSLTGLIIGLVVEERMRAEQNLRDSLQLIAAGELAGALAHELHQPMSALSAYSESAVMLLNEVGRDPSSVDKAKDVLTKVVSETLRASDIVRGLRSYFIGGASNLQKASARKIVNDCVNRLQKFADHSEVTLQQEFEHQNDFLLVDIVQINTAIGNLLKNAIDASQPGMLVVVRVSDAQESYLHISVFDQAPKLIDDVADQVFRPFFSKKKDGLGLGLSVSKALVENNGGFMRYLDSPEKCFQIIIPSERIQA
jgi:two-component system sensor kinase FixL